jgi:hypothetical protein
MVVQLPDPGAAAAATADNPRRRRARYPSCLRRSLEHQTHWRAICSWHLPLCPPHVWP